MLLFTSPINRAAAGLGIAAGRMIFAAPLRISPYQLKEARS
jgi:hypothetical protein